MPNYKVSGTVTPNATVIAYPHTDDVIYGTADATGAYEIQWTAATAEKTRVVAYDGISDPQIHVLMPANATPYTPPDFTRFFPDPNSSAITSINGGWNVDLAEDGTNKVATSLGTVSPSGSYIFKIESWNPVPSLTESYIGFTDVDPLTSANVWFFENSISYNPKDSQIRVRGAGGGDTPDIGANDNPVFFFVDFDTGVVQVFNANDNSLIVTDTFNVGGFSGVDFSMYLQSNNVTFDVIFEISQMGTLPPSIPNDVKQVGEV